jgi:predicted nucleic acid-binding Zn ribbon protein
MPIYIFINPDTGEHKEVVQRMTERHVYIDEKGLEWDRVFTPANFVVDGTLNPMSQNDFMHQTYDKNYTVGEIQDKSKEASQRRTDKYGYDPVQKKWFEDYSKKRKGKKHPSDPSRGSQDISI